MAHYEQIAIIGFGLIGSSLARAVKENDLTSCLIGCDNSEESRSAAIELKLADKMLSCPKDAVKDADLIILATPLGAFEEIVELIAPHLKKNAVITDVGSVKTSVAQIFKRHIPKYVHAIAGHPVAGTEQSGPKAGFGSLFKDRWCILTPEDADPQALSDLIKFWESLGSNVEIMSPEHHDQVLAITSHVPHLIAYNIVGTARHLEEVTKSEVIKFSAGGFRDFTRIAASDPTMWRDVFLNNKEAVLEMLGRFSEDLTALQRSIRYGDGEALFELFDKTRRIRREIIDAGQDEAAADFGRSHNIPQDEKNN